MRLSFCFAIASLIYSVFLFGYEGEEELEKLFSQIQNIKHPTFSEYRLIEQYLEFGERPYLNSLMSSELYLKKPGDMSRLRRMGRTLKLTGDHGEMPLYRLYRLGKSELQRCVLIYSSFNQPYPDKAWNLLNELQAKGFKGDVLFRIGGFPNMEAEGLKLCHVPYSWKVLFLKEAEELGYKQILWIDTSLHPLNDLESIFRTIEAQGYFFIAHDMFLEKPYKLSEHLELPLHAMQVPLDLLGMIPHLSACLIGINTEIPKIRTWVDDWYQKTKEVIPYMNWYPEELSLSVTAWLNQLRPTMKLPEVISREDNAIKSSSSFVLDLGR